MQMQAEAGQVATGTEVTTRVRRARLGVTALSWVFLALLLVQVYFAGLFLMGAEGDFRTAHQALGMSLGLVPLLMAGAAAFGSVGRRVWLTIAALVVLVLVQPSLATVSPDDGLGWLRALHPLNAVVLAVLAYRLAGLVRRA